MSNVSDNQQAAIFAEEALVVDAQIFLHELMEEKGVTRASLAKKMGVSRARVSQLFSDECKNFTIRAFARAAYALGETVEFDCSHFRIRRQSANFKCAMASHNVSWLINDDSGADQIMCKADNRLIGFVNSSYERKAAA